MKHYSKTPPRQSQLTQSEYTGACLAAQETVEDADTSDYESVVSAMQDAAQQIREAGEGCDERFNNMPEGLQQGDTGQLLEQRRDAAESLADELESAADELESACVDMEGEGKTDEEKEADLEEKRQAAAQDAVDAISWDFE